MDFGLSEEQTILQESLRRYLAERVPLDKVRAIMETESGIDHGVIDGLVKQGAVGIFVPEQFGGAGLGLLEASIIAEELGRAATPYSFHSASVMAPLFIAMCGSSPQRERWLSAIAKGAATVSVIPNAKMIVEGELDGSIRFVPDAEEASAFIARTRVSGDSRVYLVPADTPGITVNALNTVDSTRRVGEVVFEGVDLTDDMLLPEGEADEVCQRALEAGQVALAADMLGCAERALEEAVRYSLTRKQFGRVVGSFQAVKHMCAETIAEIEPLRSLLWYAAFTWDRGGADASHVIPLLKAHASEVATRAVTTAVQVFGGMGFTWECDVHLWFKRVGYDRQMLGGPIELRRQAAAALLD